MSECFSAWNVYKIYGRTRALSNVTLEMCRGLNLIIGPNGSGKSTLLKILTGLSRPTRGRVESLGMDPWRHRSRLLGMVGVAFEGARLPWWLTGAEILRIYSREHAIPLESLLEVAEELGVGDWLSRSVRSYSMGMRKKLALTTALAGDKHAIVLDEPYTLLDSKTVESLDRILARISRDKPVIVASHVHTRTLEEADKLIALVNGVVAYEKKRLTPLTSYKCTGSREELIELMKREAERIRKAEFTADNQLILDYTEPVKPPTDKCSPIIAVKPTLIEGK